MERRQEWPPTKPGTPGANPEESRPDGIARPRGFEPLAFGFVASIHGPSSLCKRMQVRANAAPVSSSECTSVQGNAGECKSLAASLLHGKSTDGEETHWGAPLLSVREAARLLGVCAATVCKLCASNELPARSSHERDPHCARRPGGVRREESQDAEEPDPVQ